MLKKSANAIIKTYGKVFGPESLAASAPDNGICVAASMRTWLIRSSNAYSKGWMIIAGNCAPTWSWGHHRQHLYRTYINDDGSVSNSYSLHHYIAEPRRIQMDQQPSTLASVLAIAAVRAQASLVNFLRTQIAVDVRTYRPEKYYMRGPGPKWREKNAPGHVSTLGSGQLLTSAAPASRTTTENVDAAVVCCALRH